MSEVFVFIATRSTADVVVPPMVSSIELNRRVANAFRAQAGGHINVGDLKLRPNGNAILNHLLCDGAAVSRVSFPELFAFLGVSEGPGDGSTTFNIPNYMAAALTPPATGPTQTVTSAGTVSSGVTVTEPDNPGEAGGTERGNILSGGRPDRNDP